MQAGWSQGDDPFPTADIDQKPGRDAAGISVRLRTEQASGLLGAQTKPFDEGWSAAGHQAQEHAEGETTGNREPGEFVKAPHGSSILRAIYRMTSVAGVLL